MAALGSLRQNVIRFLINLVIRYCLAGVFIYCCWIAIINYNYWFSWHVILCTLGIFPITSEAFTVFTSDELWSKQLARKQKYWIHGSMLILGTTLISVGSILTFYYIVEGYHLYTLHGISGLIAMILFILSLFLGLLANYSQKLSRFGRPMTFKLSHNFIGILGYLIGVISLCSAYYTRWFVYYTSEESRIVAVIATVLGTLWTVNTSLISGYNQLKTLLGK